MTAQILASFIDGKTIEHASSTFDLVAPQDGKVVGKIAEAGKVGVDKAVHAAGAAFSRHRKQPVHVRIGWLRAAAKALLDNADDLAATICTDVGKPIRMARFEVRRGAEFLEATAAALTQFGGETVPLDVTPAGAGH
ncbi:MAG TPA: aldehyde dehydrogenase family protein, partial [Bradyrhizobium sp.]